MCAHAIADSPNYVVSVFGPDDKGQSYELTLRRYPSGKTPALVHEKKIAELEVWIEGAKGALGRAQEERNQAEQNYSDLIHLCENMLKAWDEFIINGGMPDRDLVPTVESIRDHVSPGNLNSTTDAL